MCSRAHHRSSREGCADGPAMAPRFQRQLAADVSQVEVDDWYAAVTSAPRYKYGICTYAVDKLIRKRKAKGDTIEYFVRWKGTVEAFADNISKVEDVI